MKILFVFFYLCCLYACNTSEKAEVVLKDHYTFERYMPVLSRESEYLLVNLADTIQPDYRLDNGDWHFSVEVRDNKGEFFYLQDMVLYLKPGEKLKVECNHRHKYNSVFEGGVKNENSWLNQKMLRGGNILSPVTFWEFLSFEDYCKQVDRVADSLRLDLDKVSKNRKFIHDTRVRLELIRATAYSMYVDRILNSQRYGESFESQGDFEKWKSERMAEIVPKIVCKMTDVLGKYAENEIIQYVHGQTALIVLENLQEGCLSRLHFDRFLELYDYYRTKLEDPNFEYSAAVKAYAHQLSDPRLQKFMLDVVDKNRYVTEGVEMKDFEFEDVDGEKHRLSDYKGMPIYLDIWATWCNPCKAIAPNFAALAETYKKENIKFIAISIDKNVKVWRDYVKQDGKHENVEEWLCTSKEFLEIYRISSIPRFLLIDKDFKIRMTFAYKPIEVDMQNLSMLLDEVIR